LAAPLLVQDAIDGLEGVTEEFRRILEKPGAEVEV
jgi:hypothetical protein